MALDLTNFTAPGEQQIGQFLIAGLALGDHLQIGQSHLAQIAVLHQQTAGDPLVIPTWRPRAVPLTAGQYPHVLLAGGRRQCLRRDFRGDDHFDELPVHDRLGGDGVQWPVEGDDAAEGRTWIRLIRLVVGVENRCAATPQGMAC